MKMNYYYRTLRVFVVCLQTLALLNPQYNLLILNLI